MTTAVRGQEKGEMDRENWREWLVPRRVLRKEPSFSLLTVYVAGRPSTAVPLETCYRFRGAIAANQSRGRLHLGQSACRSVLHSPRQSSRSPVALSPPTPRGRCQVQTSPFLPLVSQGVCTQPFRVTTYPASRRGLFRLAVGRWSLPSSAG